MLTSILALAVAAATPGPAQPPPTLAWGGASYPLYPATTEACPELASPLTTESGREYVVVRLSDGTFGVVDVSLAGRDRQLHVDGDDFPSLARSGLHDPAALGATATITGRPVAEVTALARPGALSTEGFLAEDEDVLSVLAGDDAIVRAMGLTHPELARPLLHVWNLMLTDIDLGRWSMAHHRWRNVEAVRYHGEWVLLDAHDTKGGQLSPFADGLEGGFWIVIRRPLSLEEEELLHERYAHCVPERWDPLRGTLTRIFTGEMVPHFVMWYGFYEGHTAWRADPVGIARVFGLRSLAELEATFPGRLPEVIARHHVRD